MNKIINMLGIALVGGALFSCSSNGPDLIDSTADYPKPPADIVSGTSLSGTLKGSLQKDQAYTLDGDVVVNPGDTLAVQQGVTVTATGNYKFIIDGTLLSLGTDADPVYFTTNNGSKYADLGVKGYWGGFLIDSTATYIYMRFTHIDFTGGPDSEGGAQASFDVEGSQTYHADSRIVFEDNWMFGGIDDGIHLAGDITVSIKRNVLQRLGGPDGETMNIKKGVKGDIAYNYIWSGANNGIKLETSSSVFSPQTKMNIFNNTIINSGWRKVGEATQGILIDKFTAANIYNNILVGNHSGINITKEADTINTHYGYNLIYAINDSLKNWVYSVGSFGKIQSTDKIGSGLSDCGSVFTHWDSGVTPETTTQDNNVPSLSSGSPAIGAGTTSANFAYWITSSGNYGTADVLDTDMGAYPTDGKGNKHLPETKPSN